MSKDNQKLLDEIRTLTLWGSNIHNRYAAGSREDLYERITAIRTLVEKNGATLS